MMAAVKYLVEELGADVNALDDEGNMALLEKLGAVNNHKCVSC